MPVLVLRKMERNQFSARSKTTDNSSVLDKISDAVGNFNGGNSFENTFNITGSNPKEIAEEVSNIIQRQVERRDASWA